MSRFWTFASNLLPGQTARAEQVNEKLQEIDTAFETVAGEANRTIRLMDGTPAETDYQLLQTAPARANRILGFNASGGLALLSTSFSWRGTWASGLQYDVNDVVKQPAEPFSLYIVRSSHVSTDFSADVAAFRLEVIIDLTEVRRSLVLHELIIGPNTVQLEHGDDVMCDVTNGGIVLILPAAPSISSQPVNIMHVAGNLGSFPITVQGGGAFIMGLNEDMIVDTANASFGMAYAGSAYGWRIRGV